MGWTSNYALCPADSLLVRTSVRMTLSAPPNSLAFTCERPSAADRQLQRLYGLVRRRPGRTPRLVRRHRLLRAASRLHKPVAGHPLWFEAPPQGPAV